MVRLRASILRLRLRNGRISGRTQQQAYDYLVVATGLKRHWPAVPKSGSYEEYLRDGKAFIEKITGGDESKHQGRRVVVADHRLVEQVAPDARDDVGDLAAFGHLAQRRQEQLKRGGPLLPVDHLDARGADRAAPRSRHGLRRP